MDALHTPPAAQFGEVPANDDARAKPIALAANDNDRGWSAPRPSLIASVDGTIALRTDTLPAKLHAQLQRDLTLPNPEFARRRRMGLPVWNVPERIECTSPIVNGLLRIPRGVVASLRAYAAHQGLRITFEDHRAHGAELGLTAGFGAELRDYQNEAVTAAARGVQGSIIMPCGAGKSTVGCALISRIGRSTLVIVHTRDLLEQWKGVVKSRLSLDAGVITDGVVQAAPVTIATVQTLVRLSPEALAEVGQRFGVVIVDECQHAPASTFQSVLAALPAKWRYGLTATPEREDGLTPLIDFTFGPRLYEIAYEDLVAKGLLHSPSIVPVFTDFVPECDPSDHAACMAALVGDADRNQLILDRVIAEANGGHTVLVLSGRVDHCNVLAARLKAEGIEAGVLVGTTAKDMRTALLDRFRAGDLRVLLACTIADEGLDVPRLDRIVLAFPSRTQGRTTQRLGRLMRPHPGKGQPVLYDIVDARVPMLYRQYLVRRRLYRSLLGAHLDIPLPPVSATTPRKVMR